MTSRVVIVSPRPILREALSRWVEEAGDLDVVEEVARGEDALVSATHSRPDIIILEADMPGVSGFEVAGAISQTFPGMGIIIIADTADRDVRKKAADVGARGVVSKSWGREAFRMVVRLVEEGRSPPLIEVHGRPGRPPQ
jgi:two-component system response regulator DesR